MQTVKVLILGATGGTGRHATLEALARGYDVTALVRNRAKVPPEFARVRVIDGDARDPTAVASAVQGQDGVVCVLGLGTGKAGLTPNALIATTAPILISAMTAANVRRLVFTSAFGIADTAHDAPLLPRIVFAFVLQNVYADKAIGDTAVRQSALDWTIVYPTLLTDKPKTGRIRAGEHLSLKGFPKIARADVGAFLIEQLEGRDYIRKGVLISS